MVNENTSAQLSGEQGDTTGKGPQAGTQASKPTPGYDLVKDDSGKLSVEVPSGWKEHITGKDGTFDGKDADPGKGVGPAITATTDLNAWQVTGGPVPGMYMVASRELTQQYTENQLVASGFNDRSASCDAGAGQDFKRSPYSGRMQIWNCRVDGSTIYTLAAAPEDRQCIVMLNIKIYSEADREAARHILDTFDADCRAIS